MALALNSDWASLPVYLLDSILDCLVPMEDYFRFSEVCIEWQNAVREKLPHLPSNHKRHCLLHQQVPLLIAPAVDNPRDRCCLYDVMQGKSLYEFELRLGRWRCEGSSHGWLILVDGDSFKVTLLNPFSRKRIHLPPIEKSIFLQSPKGVYKLILSKPRRGVLSNDPDANNGEFVLMMTCSDYFGGRIAFIKSGEEDWTYIKDLRDLEDIVYSNGLFYVLDSTGVLFSCDVSNDIKVRRITFLWIPGAHGVSYLVESPEGDLLRVIKHGGAFVINKLVWFSRYPRWEEVTSLGDVALFLGDSHSTSITTSDFAGCQPNSIYFCRPDSFDPGSIYIYSLNDRTVTPLLYPRSRQPLVWISPRFV